MTQVEGESEGETVMMRVEVPRKDESKQNGQEAVEFTYNLVTDKPEDVVGEMVIECNDMGYLYFAQEKTLIGQNMCFTSLKFQIACTDTVH